MTQNPPLLGKSALTRLLPVSPRLRDGLLATAVGSVAVATSLRSGLSLDPSLYGSYAPNVWFQADLPRTLANMTDALSDHYRTGVHPLSSLVLHPYVSGVIGTVWPGSRLEVALRATALLGGAWCAAMFYLLRLLNLSRFAAVAFTLLGAASAAFVFWFSVAETYGFSSLTLLAVLLCAAFADRYGRASSRLLVLANVVSLAGTITNWMAGIALALRARGAWKSWRVLGLALLITLGLAGIQKYFFPSSQIFLWNFMGETEYLNRPEGGSTLTHLRVLAADTVIAPAAVATPVARPAHDLLTSQHAVAGSATVYGKWLLVAWAVLAIAGAWGWFRARSQFPFFTTTLGLTLAGQILLHLVYGEETFLYTLHLLPLWIATAAGSARIADERPWSLGALLLAAACLAHNLTAFEHARTLVASGLNQRDQVLLAMRSRPDTPWPRQVGHVLLSVPGSAWKDKAYHDPGASFSPSPASFGVSLWVTDARGTRRDSSESLPLAGIEQSYDWPATATAPSVVTKTRYFQARWTRLGADSALELWPAADAPQSLWLMVRSVGPAGAPLGSAQASAQRAVLDGRWEITFGAPVLGWAGGDEQTAPMRLDAPAVAVDAHSATGWAWIAARLDARPLTVHIRDLSAAGGDVPPPWSTLPRWQPQLESAAFMRLAGAQQIELLTGLTDGRTRPGDPTNYTAESMREAAYIAVALARAGQRDIAARLARRIAASDFLDAEASEGDALGLGLWALDQVSSAADDAALARELLPDVRRKVERLASCLESPAGLTIPTDSAWVASKQLNRPCYRSRDGLIVGQVAGQFPILYTSAAGYMGLLAAQQLAARAGDDATAAHARRLAARLPDAWRRLLGEDGVRRRLDAWRSGPDESLGQRYLGSGIGGLRREAKIALAWSSAARDPRALSNALWPSWIAAPGDGMRILREALGPTTAPVEPGWRARPDPASGVALAHQALLLGDGTPARGWIEWLDSRSPSPGLGATWRGVGEQFPGDLWANMRGLMQPQTLSPDYRASAETLLLLTDMLAYVDEADATRPLVIGAGLSAEDIAKPIDSGRLYTSRGLVRWRLEARTVEVSTCDPHPVIRLAPALAGFQARVHTDCEGAGS